MFNKNNIIIALVAFVVGALGAYFLISPKIMDSSNTILKSGDVVFVHYTGKLADGTIFDSSDQPVNGQPARNKPFQFVLGAGMVIKGWDEGVVGMKIGEKKTLTISPEKAYGAQGVPDGKGGYIIPPNATLTFDVEVLDALRSLRPQAEVGAQK
jgi:FKBP-type peptidyl-prolyl cis-trans isomerase FkpA